MRETTSAEIYCGIFIILLSRECVGHRIILCRYKNGYENSKYYICMYITLNWVYFLIHHTSIHEGDGNENTIKK